MKKVFGTAAIFLSVGCINYSSYQDARIVERGHSQGTVAVSLSRYSPRAGSYENDANWLVFQVDPRWGLGGRVDAALHMSALVPTDQGGSGGWVVLGADARVGIIRNYLAATLPISMALSEFAFSSANIQPGIIVTVPVADAVDINASGRRSIYLSNDIDTEGFWLVNAGLGIKVAPAWRIRPELGWLISDTQRDYNYYDGTQETYRTVYTQFGIGVSHGE